MPGLMQKSHVGSGWVSRADPFGTCVVAAIVHSAWMTGLILQKKELSDFEYHPVLSGTVGLEETTEKAMSKIGKQWYHSGGKAWCCFGLI